MPGDPGACNVHIKQGIASTANKNIQEGTYGIKWWIFSSETATIRDKITKWSLGKDMQMRKNPEHALFGKRAPALGASIF